ncbi:MAG: hypothetical protein ACRECH_18220 [Nitrososphaerales archaeon]
MSEARLLDATAYQTLIESKLVSMYLWCQANPPESLTPLTLPGASNVYTVMISGEWEVLNVAEAEAQLQNVKPVLATESTLIDGPDPAGAQPLGSEFPAKFQ